MSPVSESVTPPRTTGPEDVRNRRLRRVDWRFLLSDPSPRRTLCLSAGPLAESLRLVSETVVEAPDAAPAGGFDLAVAIEPDREALAIARSALRGGGVLYSEWRGAASRRRAALGRRLELAGFEAPRFYWPHPDPMDENPSVWIPLQTPGALRHALLENRGRSRTAWRRAARAAVRSSAVAKTWFGAARPVCALARKPPAAGPGPALEHLARQRWPQPDAGGLPDTLSTLLLTGGLRSESKVVALVFPDSSSRPAVAIKMARVPEAEASVLREADVLRRLGERLEGRAADGVPRLLFLDRIGETTTLGETAFSGVPLLSAWTRDDYGDFAMKAASWLADLAGRPVAQPPATWRARLVDVVFARFVEAFGRVVDAGVVREAEALLGTLPALPLVCEQRDFSPWNVLRTPNGELAVVDWESAELDGLPVLDLVYFLVSLGFSMDGARSTGQYRSSYRATLDPSTERGELAGRCLVEYRRRLGLDAAVVRPLRLLAGIVHSRSDFLRLQADFGPAPDVEVLRTAVWPQLVDEEIRHARGESA